MNMIPCSPDISWIRTEDDHVAIAYNKKDGIAVYVIEKHRCKDHTYIEILGCVTDYISQDIGHSLSRDDVFNIAKASRETLLAWCK